MAEWRPPRLATRMNAVEIEAAVSELAEAPFDAAEFPYAFLAAFGNKATLARLRKGDTNKPRPADWSAAKQQHSLTVAKSDLVSETLNALRASPETV